ncbi:MAG: hypothetical protein AAFU80_00495 [Pseudomonadota bacterium]
MSITNKHRTRNRRTKGAAERELAAATAAFDVIRTEVADLLHEVRAGETGRAKKLAPMIVELARTIGVLARAGEMVDDARRSGDKDGYAGAEAALDLDAARAEVKRRLDQLRATI